MCSLDDDCQAGEKEEVIVVVVDETRDWMVNRPFTMSTDDIVKAMKHCGENYEKYRIRYNFLREELNGRLKELSVDVPDRISSEEG